MSKNTKKQIGLMSALPLAKKTKGGGYKAWQQGRQGEIFKTYKTISHNS